MQECSLPLHRLKGVTSVAEMAVRLGEDNPGALTLVAEIFKNPDITEYARFKYVFAIDSLEVYGSKLYMLWNDCCDRNIDKVFKVLKSYIEGKITAEQIHTHINYENGRGIPFEDKELGGI